MKEIKCTLLSDGSSDRALIPVLRWLLEGLLPDTAIQWDWADFGFMPKPPKLLHQRIQLAVEQYPCDLLFVHRDAEREARDKRVAEIDDAYHKARENGLTEHFPIAICTIPVRMLEAWLLTNEQAIRMASSNPGGKAALNLPPIQRLEQLPDPKERLHATLRLASELSGRKAKKFNIHRAVHRIAETTEDFSPLLQLEAFKQLKTELESILPG